MPPLSDDAAWLDLFRAHMPGLYGAVSRSVGGRRELAEDVAQEAWLRALEHWRRRGVPHDPGAWLRTVARNLLRNHLRDRREREALDLAHLADPRSEVDARHEAGARAERDAALRAGLDGVDPEQARLLRERHLDGRSVADLAAARGVGERAVEGRLRRARHALARRLGRANPPTHPEPALPEPSHPEHDAPRPGAPDPRTPDRPGSDR